MGTLGTRDIFGEVSALSDRAQCFTFRTRTLSQLLRLKQATLKEAMQSKPADSVTIIKNFHRVMHLFLSLSGVTRSAVSNLCLKDTIVCWVLVLQHQIEVSDMMDLLGENAAEDGGSGNIPCNLLTVAATGNSSFLEDLLRVGMDPDVGDSKGRTALVSS